MPYLISSLAHNVISSGDAPTLVFHLFCPGGIPLCANNMGQMSYLVSIQSMQCLWCSFHIYRTYPFRVCFCLDLEPLQMAILWLPNRGRFWTLAQLQTGWFPPLVPISRFLHLFLVASTPTLDRWKLEPSTFRAWFYFRREFWTKICTTGLMMSSTGIHLKLRLM